MRRPLEINKPFLKIHQDLSTEKLIELIEETDFIITLFKNDSVYHKDRISGIVPFAISFGKPLIMDNEYQQLTGCLGDNNLVYKNSFTDFRRKLKYSMEMKNNEYSKMVKNMIDNRNIKIVEQYLNFNLIFN